jgi:hypothetical protein
MSFVLGGTRRHELAIADLNAALQLAPQREGLVLAALELRSRAYSAIAKSVTLADYRTAQAWHDKAVSDAKTLSDKEADLISRAGHENVLASAWSSIPPPVRQELQRRREAHGAGYSSVFSEVSMDAAFDMERRGFFYRREAEIAQRQWTNAAKVVFETHGGPILEKGTMWTTGESSTTVKTRFENAFRDIADSLGRRHGYREMAHEADRCFALADDYALPGHSAELPTRARHDELTAQDWAWQDTTLRWSALLQRLEFEYLDRYAPWLLTVSQYFPAVAEAHRAALLKPQVAADRPLRDWYGDESTRN